MNFHNLQSPQILSSKLEIDKYLGTLVPYYGIGSVMETLSTNNVTLKQ
jgi:hypothetical protein